MRLKKSWMRSILACTFILGIAILAMPSSAQDNRGGNRAASQSRRSSSTNTRRSSTSRTSNGSRQTTRTRTTQSNTNQRGNGGTRQTTRTVTNRTSNMRQIQPSQMNNRRTVSGDSRPLRISATPGRRMGPSDWRSIHPDWDGGLFFRGGLYYYDAGFSYPAIVDNEWSAIAAVSGGVALLGALENDPTLYFAGTVGAIYSFSQYQMDQGSSDPMARLRASYFGKPYFWRDGTRYDRTTVWDGGVRSYQFVRR